MTFIKDIPCKWLLGGGADGGRGAGGPQGEGPHPGDLPGGHRPVRHPGCGSAAGGGHRHRQPGIADNAATQVSAFWWFVAVNGIFSD